MHVIDVETFPNYFLFAAINLDTNERVFIELPGGDVEKIQEIMSGGYSVSFNGLAYDLPMIECAIEHSNNKILKSLSDDLIKSLNPYWETCRKYSLKSSYTSKHIDLINISPGIASLKIYGGRLNAPKMQDLPYDPDNLVDPEMIKIIREYCFNDIETTVLLYKSLKEQISLRINMSAKYKLNLLSKSDAQIAEAVIRKLVENKICNRLEKYANLETTIRYDPPSYIMYQSSDLNEILDSVVRASFNLSDIGSVRMPDWLSKLKLEFYNSQYRMGIGGLHSCEKKQFVKAADDMLLIDFDVASMYPSMITNQRLEPENMKGIFINIYKSFIEERLEAKHKGDKITSDTLKIFLNGSFGKFGSKYSILYSPKLLIQTTITGQLSLLMLIESLEIADIKVISANTDGIVVHCHKDLEPRLIYITNEWMTATNLILERTDYQLIASRDVNSYIALKRDNTLKLKGAFAQLSLSKNPDKIICYEAVANLIAYGIEIEKTIKECEDITKFVNVRRVTGGSIWKDQDLGKAVRFYKSSKVDQETCLQYKKNGNKVPKSQGCRPLMELPDAFPDDVDYEHYIMEAEKILKGVGYVRDKII